jgi:hypothetical protein
MKKYKRYRHQDFYHIGYNKNKEMIIMPKEDFIEARVLNRLFLYI